MCIPNQVKVILGCDNRHLPLLVLSSLGLYRGGFNFCFLPTE